MQVKGLWATSVEQNQNLEVAGTGKEMQYVAVDDVAYEPFAQKIWSMMGNETAHATDGLGPRLGP